MLLYLGVFSEYISLTRQLPENRRLACYGALGVLFIMERVFSGFSVITFPQAKKEGLAAGFETAARKKGDCILLCLWMAGSSLLFLSLFQNTATAVSYTHLDVYKRQSFLIYGGGATKEHLTLQRSP